jgi:recombination associated protein RdgC
MGFMSGSVTFKRLLVLGDSYKRVDDAVLERLSAHAMGADSIRTADKTELGWVTGEHILDTRFDFSKNALADGLYFALRIDTNKPPPDLVRSYQKLNEEAMLEASGRDFLSKAERREAKEQATSRADKEAAAGAFRRSKMVPAFWDLKRGEVYLGSTAGGVIDQFLLLFRQSFDRSLVPLTSGELAARWCVSAGEARAYDDCSPAHFVTPPDGATDPAETFASREGASKDFLGTEWLTWLMYTADVGASEITTPQGHNVSILFEKALQLECAFKLSGTLSATADAPAELPEISVAMATGKRPIRAGLQIAVHGDGYGLTLRGDAMNYGGVRLPDPTDATGPRAIFEDRMEHLRDLIEAMQALYVAFLKKRLSNKWPATLNAVRAWLAAGREAGASQVESVLPSMAAAS